MHVDITFLHDTIQFKVWGKKNLQWMDWYVKKKIEKNKLSNISYSKGISNLKATMVRSCVGDSVQLWQEMSLHIYCMQYIIWVSKPLKLLVWSLFEIFKPFEKLFRYSRIKYNARPAICHKIIHKINNWIVFANCLWVVMLFLFENQ